MEDVCNILIVEDDELIAMDMERMVQGMDHRVVGVVVNSKDALETIQDHEVDLAILDVRIQGEYDGIELADKIQMIDEDIAILFVTSMQDDLTFNRASRSKPSGYIVKPFSEIQFQRSVALIIKQLDQRSVQKSPDRDIDSDIQFRADSLLVRKRNEIKRIYFRDIFYLEADGGKYSKVFVENNVYVIRYSLKNLMEKISSDDFMQCHRSYIINISKISSVDLTQNTIFLGQHQIPVSRREKSALMKRLDYL